MKHRDIIYAQYDLTLQRRGRYNSLEKPPVILRKPWLPKDKSLPILDFGCGFGDMLRSLWATGYRNLVGVESSGPQITKCKEMLPAEIKIYSQDGFEHLWAHLGYYQMIVAFDVFEHFTKDEAVELCAAMRAALRPGGALVVNVPNMGAFSGSFYRHVCLTHLCGYTDSSLFQLFDSAGFEGHKLLESEGQINLRLWRPWRPFTGFGLRGLVNNALHRFVYWLGGTPPPKCFDTKLEAWTNKPSI